MWFSMVRLPLLLLLLQIWMYDTFVAFNSITHIRKFQQKIACVFVCALSLRLMVMTVSMIHSHNLSFFHLIQNSMEIIWVAPSPNEFYCTRRRDTLVYFNQSAFRVWQFHCLSVYPLRTTTMHQFVFMFAFDAMLWCPRTYIVAMYRPLHTNTLLASC